MKIMKIFLEALVIIMFLSYLFSDNVISNRINKNELFYFSLVKNFLLGLFSAIAGIKIRNKMDGLLDSKEKREWRSILYFTRILVFLCVSDVVTMILEKIFET
ncbi:hypothetical protein [Haliscomenobacter sp.]|uniref:hypothetical protein n=1 Tax=Haliscomenobacter sp. TaxID=2717303 RepID=UPI003364DE50